jgi:hypothetical protein
LNLTLTTMTTKMRKYRIEWHIGNVFDENGYYQLIRIKDSAILYTNENLNNVKVFCWEDGIKFDDVILL